MLVLENLLNSYWNIIPNFRPNNTTLNPIETKVVEHEGWVRAIDPATQLSVLMAQRIPAPLPSKITHLVEVNPEVDCTIFDGRRPSQKYFCPAGVWTRVFATIDGSHPAATYGYNITSYAPEIIGKWVRARNPISVAGDQAPDIWLPPESALTPEQIATLPPYGEYKEIKSF